MSDTYSSFPSAYRIHILSEVGEEPEKIRNGPVHFEKLVGDARKYLEKGHGCNFTFIGKTHGDCPIEVKYDDKKREITIYELSDSLKEALNGEKGEIGVDCIGGKNPIIYIEPQTSK
ncbi:MAG: hypothetical protein GOV00_02985 [Candidatus Altiarchaeota archaeon]|nr:hypothetical protein [Candidatus Altiarchaeota archaeon]